MKERKIKNEIVNKGITLIALVITIAVLIILAGISLGAITGNDGLINKTKEAKNSAGYSQWEEKIESARIDVENRKINPTLEDVIEELKNKGIIDDESQVNKETGAITTNEPVYTIEGKLDDYLDNIEEGIMEEEKNGTLAKVKGTEETNTEVYDSLGNKVIVPAGFKVVNPESNVEDGIIIKDRSHEATVDSEFVWIPVGTIQTKKGTKTITLSRYTFDSNGNSTNKGSNAIAEDGYNYQELNTGNGNRTAKENIESEEEGFRGSAIKNGGYYIGRYEARTAKEREAETDTLTQITIKPNEYLYNYVTQAQAAEISQEMYDDKNFESDLMNSYAWDTATVFIQQCLENNDYSMQNSLNKEILASQGTNNLETKDEKCNIYDMASNCWEWTTETCSYFVGPCVRRGGSYLDSDYYTAQRSYVALDISSNYNTFRPILYL